MVEGLVLININPCAEGWMDWAAHKVSPTNHINKSYIYIYIYEYKYSIVAFK